MQDEQDAESAASDKSLKSQASQRALASLQFLELLAEKTDFPAVHLEIFPMSAVACLSRWYRRDPINALEAGIKLVCGELTTKTLRDAELQSRKQLSLPGSGKALAANYRRRIAGEVARIARTVGPVDLCTAAQIKSYGKDISGKVDFAFADDKGRPVAAFVIVGPYRDADIYPRRAFDWISKAYLLLKVFKFVYVIIPENGDPLIFARLWHRLNIDPDRLRIKKIQPLPRGSSKRSRSKAN